MSIAQIIVKKTILNINTFNFLIYYYISLKSWLPR